MLSYDSLPLFRNAASSQSDSFRLQLSSVSETESHEIGLKHGIGLKAETPPLPSPTSSSDTDSSTGLLLPYKTTPTTNPDPGCPPSLLVPRLHDLALSTRDPVLHSHPDVSFYLESDPTLAPPAAKRRKRHFFDEPRAVTPYVPNRYHRTRSTLFEKPERVGVGVGARDGDDSSPTPPPPAPAPAPARPAFSGEWRNSYVPRPDLVASGVLLSDPPIALIDPSREQWPLGYKEEGKEVESASESSSAGLGEFDLGIVGRDLIELLSESEKLKVESRKVVKVEEDEEQKGIVDVVGGEKSEEEKPELSGDEGIAEEEEEQKDSDFHSIKSVVPPPGEPRPITDEDPLLELSLNLDLGEDGSSLLESLPGLVPLPASPSREEDLVSGGIHMPPPPPALPSTAPLLPVPVGHGSLSESLPFGVPMSFGVGSSVVPANPTVGSMLATSTTQYCEELFAAAAAAAAMQRGNLTREPELGFVPPSLKVERAVVLKPEPTAPDIDIMRSPRAMNAFLRGVNSSFGSILSSDGAFSGFVDKETQGQLLELKNHLGVVLERTMPLFAPAIPITFDIVHKKKKKKVKACTVFYDTQRKEYYVVYRKPVSVVARVDPSVDENLLVHAQWRVRTRQMMLDEELEEDECSDPEDGWSRWKNLRYGSVPGVLGGGVEGWVFVSTMSFQEPTELDFDFRISKSAHFSDRVIVRGFCDAQFRKKIAPPNLFSRPSFVAKCAPGDLK